MTTVVSENCRAHVTPTDAFSDTLFALLVSLKLGRFMTLELIVGAVSADWSNGISTVEAVLLDSCTTDRTL